MDFFERQHQARRKTKLLVVYMALAVLLTIVLIYAGLIAIMGTPRHSRQWTVERSHQWENPAWARWWNPQLMAGVSLVTGLIVFGGSLHRLSELRGGGTQVATRLGGRRVNPQSPDPEERKLLNVVEEMAIASGIPMPELYLLDGEEGINAFAVGNSTSDAIVGVTRGCVRLLTRDELQGVIAHEFSHILNGDMRLNLRLIGIVFGLLVLVLFGRILWRASRGAGRKNPLPLVGLVLILAGLIGAFFARLIKSAVARQREFLADAAAVQFTRNPGGLAGALKKIGGLGQGSRLTSDYAEEASHLFFSNALSGFWSQFMSTHPPLEQRIRLLDPAFDGEYPLVTGPESGQERAAESRFVTQVAQSSYGQAAMPIAHEPIRGRAALLRRQNGEAERQLRPTESRFMESPAGLITLVGAPLTDHLIHAADLVNVMPDELHQAAREPFSAAALIYAILLSPEEKVRKTQLQGLELHTSPLFVSEALRLSSWLDQVGRSTKLPLVGLALTALRGLSAPQYEQFSQAIQFLVEADESIDLFEYAVQKMVRRHLEPFFVGKRKPIVQYYAFKVLEPDGLLLLSALAQTGHVDPAEAEKAFRLGLAKLAVETLEIPMLAITDCGLTRIDAALDRLSQAIPPLKKRMLEACAYTASADGIIQENEAQLLRAIADTLDCPIPPLLGAHP